VLTCTTQKFVFPGGIFQTVFYTKRLYSNNLTMNVIQLIIIIKQKDGNLFIGVIEQKQHAYKINK